MPAVGLSECLADRDDLVGQPPLPDRPRRGRAATSFVAARSKDAQGQARLLDGYALGGNFGDEGLPGFRAPPPPRRLPLRRISTLVYSSTNRPNCFRVAQNAFNDV